MTENENPVVSTAKAVKSRTDGSNNVITLSDGRRAKILPVTASLIDEVTSSIKDPPVPMFYIKDREETVPNPDDPNYIKECAEKSKERGGAAIDALMMFGVELLDGVPDDDAWLNKLKNLQRMGRLNLAEYNLEDPVDREFLYKKFIIGDNRLIQKITEVSAITQADIEEAERSFRGS